MAQPAQLIWGPSGEYNVIDNGPPGVVSTNLVNGPVPSGSGNLTGNGLPNFDTTSGAIAQSTNAFKNGTVPDFVATGATTVLNSPLSTRLVFKNPS